MIIRLITLAALILISAAIAIAGLVLLALALDAVAGWLQSLDARQRGAIGVAGLACVLVAVIEICSD